MIDELLELEDDYERLANMRLELAILKNAIKTVKEGLYVGIDGGEQND